MPPFPTPSAFGAPGRVHSHKSSHIQPYMKVSCPAGGTRHWPLSCPNNDVYFGQMKRGQALDLKSQIDSRIAAQSGIVWTPVDFLDLAPRAAVDKALQRLVTSGSLSRIDRGLYFRPRKNALTGKATNPDQKAVIDAVARRDQTRVVVDGLTAANDLGLTTAVPARVIVLTDARLRPIRLGNQHIQFKTVAPSRLYWAGRPAMRVVQALYWLQDILQSDPSPVLKRLKALLRDPDNGTAIRNDLRQGIHTLPIWMQAIVRGLIGDRTAAPSKPQPRPRHTTATA